MARMELTNDQNHSFDSTHSKQEVRKMQKERRVKRLEKDVKSLETELEDLDECVDRETLVDLIQEIVPLLIGKKGKALFESSEDSDSDEIIEGFHWCQDLSNQDLKKCHSINDIWQIQCGNTVKDFYSKLKKYNKSFGYSEKFLNKCALLKGLSPENVIKVRMNSLHELALDEIVERLSPEQ
ncbi:hypothetical protein C1645_836587 [Glomus cerebriforme]|uniref:Uncharacterized protein n=1 Tax=Glomus cerebriforme TaxID=658196 RepID=A0A397S5M7_9GLOM|nr:hypothetical protein C1645_836587 [Glomus cerebriforme]